MTTFKAILSTLLLSGALTQTPEIKNPWAKWATNVGLLVGTVLITKKNSDTNPDGTPAKVAYIPLNEK